MTRAHVLFSGRVQGVGFRYMTQRFASHLHLTGWVKNLPDGRVEAIIEGEETVIEQLFERLEEHFQGNIKEKKVNFQPGQNQFQGFQITY